MSELQKLLFEKRVPHPCRLSQVLDAVSAEDRAFLIEAVSDESVPLTRIATAVRNALQMTLSRDVVARHRIRECAECDGRGYVFTGRVEPESAG